MFINDALELRLYITKQKANKQVFLFKKSLALYSAILFRV